MGLVVLRVKEPDLERCDLHTLKFVGLIFIIGCRPYKVWIITPLAFSAVALFLLCMPVFAAPLQAFAALGRYLSVVSSEHPSKPCIRVYSSRDTDLLLYPTPETVTSWR